MKNFILVLSAVILAVIGEVLLKASMNRFGLFSLDPRHLPMNIARLLQDPLVLSALAAYAIATLFWLAALSRAELSYLYPMLSMSYILVTLSAKFILHEAVSLMRLIGVVIICIGIIVVSRS